MAFTSLNNCLKKHSFGYVEILVRITLFHINRLQLPNKHTKSLTLSLSLINRVRILIFVFFGEINKKKHP